MAGPFSGLGWWDGVLGLTVGWLFIWAWMVSLARLLNPVTRPYAGPFRGRIRGRKEKRPLIGVTRGRSKIAMWLISHHMSQKKMAKVSSTKKNSFSKSMSYRSCF